ncbi:MAG: 6,7-dimethyl-8-ribityllumazine synthase [Deltaproteobacteria bacterium]|nr:6,7-dimethyl-8-ribityllumazine synthase [Deltaproteobacteria bacterium]
MREFLGKPFGTGLRVAIVVARFNRSVTESLLDGALAGLREHGVADQAIDVLRVPGAFEITVAAEHCAASGRYAALICLGAVVRGETPHFEFISREVSRGVNDVACRHRIPVAFGVLTTDTMEQALARAGDGHGNKGYEAAITALEMAALLREHARLD